MLDPTTGHDWVSEAAFPMQGHNKYGPIRTIRRCQGCHKAYDPVALLLILSDPKHFMNQACVPCAPPTAAEKEESFRAKMDRLIDLGKQLQAEEERLAKENTSEVDSKE